MGDIKRMQVSRPGVRAWANSGQLTLGAYRLGADLGLASQYAATCGFGGLIACYQTDQTFCLFGVDNQEHFQFELAEKGAWRTIWPWKKTPSLSSGRQSVLSVAVNWAKLHFNIYAASVGVVADPRQTNGRCRARSRSSQPG